MVRDVENLTGVQGRDGVVEAPASSRQSLCGNAHEFGRSIRPTDGDLSIRGGYARNKWGDKEAEKG